MSLLDSYLLLPLWSCIRKDKAVGNSNNLVQHQIMGLLRPIDAASVLMYFDCKYC